MWMSAIVVLPGAELNSEIEHQTAADSTEGGDKPLGRRGARMAEIRSERRKHKGRKGPRGVVRS